MTDHMTDERLAELRAFVAGGDRTESDSVVHMVHNLPITYIRSLLARLDAAEDLIREVAHSCEHPEFDDERIRWLSVQIDRETVKRCGSYLR